MDFTQQQKHVFHALRLISLQMLVLISFILFTAESIAYPNINNSYIMNDAAGTAGGWNTTQNDVCSTCHVDNGSTGATFTSLDSPIKPLAYDYFYFGITTGPSSPVRGGFNMKVVNSAGTTTGTLAEFDANAVMDGSIARHTNSTDNSWYLRWIAPSSATSVRFSYCANSVNNSKNDNYADNIGENGDNIDCSYKSVTVNSPPHAVDDIFSVYENHSGSGYFYPITHGVNDSDIESSNTSLTLTYSGSSISGATLSCSTFYERCTVSLTSDFNYLDSGESVILSGFRDYKLNDSSWTSSNSREISERTGRMTVRVYGLNDAPTADNDSGYTINEGATSTTQISLASILTGDNDVDNSDTLTVQNLVCISNCTSVTKNGTHVLFRHNGSETTTASFRYRAYDGTTYSNYAYVTINITPVNDAPTADNDSGYTINEGATSTTQITLASLLSGDNDNEGDSLTVTFLACITNCSSVSINGSYVQFQHDGSETTTASFRYYAFDGSTYSNQAFVTVAITPQNDAPIADNDSGYTINEGATSTTQISLANLLTGDADAEGDTLTVTNLNCTTNCTSVSSNGTYVLLTHDGGETTSATFTYRAYDGQALSNKVIVTVAITPQNDVPTADDDSGYTINEGTTSTTQISIASLLSGDSDNDGDSLTVGSLNCGTNCSSLSSNGTYILFQHDGSETTSASFTYRANDGTINSNTAMVSININPTNDAPIADNESGYNLNEGATSTTQISLASLLEGDTDSENDSLSVTNLICATNCSSVAKNGTYVLFTHNGSETTSATFTYTANDGLLDSNAATVTLTITPQNDVPIANNDGGYTINEGSTSTTQISLASLLLGDTDDDGDSLTVTNLACATNCFSVTDNGSYVLFKHDDSETISASFTYTANDGTVDSSAATVTVTITPQNDVPIASNDSGFTINENATSTTQISLVDILSNDIDNESNSLSVTNLSCATNCGAVSSNGTHILFQHDGSETTSASFTYTANDGTIDSNSAIVTINITPQNDTPVAGNDTGFTLNEGAMTNTQISLANLLSNDVDNDNVSLSVTNLSCVSNCDSVSDNGIYVVFTHDGSETTSASFSYTANDGTINSNIATVTLTITPQNDLPIAFNDSGYTLNEGATSTTEISIVSLMSNDSDDDLSDTLTITNLVCDTNCIGVLNNATHILFTHDDSETTSASFTYTLNDGSVDSNVATVFITITAINDAPTISVLANDFSQGSGHAIGNAAASYTISDSEVGSLTVSFTTGTNTNSHYTLDTGNNQVLITATALTIINNGNAIDNINLTVTDVGLLTDSDSDSPTVFVSTNPPTFIELAQAVNVNEDSSINVTYSATDVDSNDSLIEWSVNAQATNGSVTIIGGSTGGSAVYRYTPNGDYVGNDSFISKASSAGAEIFITTSITVNPQNDAPIADDDIGYILNEGATSTTEITIASLMSNDSDKDFSDTLSITNLACVTNCSSVSANATHVIFQHDGSEANTATFTYTAFDGTTNSNVATVTLSITPQNDAPIADDDSGYSNREGATSTTEISIASLLSGDTDAEGDGLSVTNLLCVSNCTSVNINGLYISFTHDGSETTSASFTYTANDGTTDSNVATVTLVIAPQNDAPIANNDSGYSIGEGATSTTEITLASLLVNDTDAEGDSLTVTNLSCALNCSSVSSNGTHILLQHDGTETSTATFTYTSNDGVDDSNSATVTVNILGNNDTPIADDDSGYTINEAATSTTEITLASLLSGDTDADGDTLSVTNLLCVSNCSNVSINGLNVSFTHDGSETTIASFTYTANDGTIDSNVATVSLTITAQNDAPVADNDSGYNINEGATSSTEISIASLLAGDTDAENDSLSVTNLSCATNCANISDNGTYVLFTHDNSETTSATFTYTVNDGTVDSNMATVTLVITPQNDAPIADNDSGYSINEGATSTTEISLASLLSGDTDAENDNLTVSNLSCALNCVNVSANSTHIIVQHDGSETSTTTFTYTANDGSLDSNSAIVTINIIGNNDTPVADNDSGYTINEAATSTTEISLASLLAGDTDGDGDSLSVNNLVCATNCSSVSANGTHVLFQHDGSETTAATFTYTANDGIIDSNTATVSLTITPVNDVPVALNDSGYTIIEGSTSNNQISLVSLLTNDTDAEGDSLSVTNLSCVSNCLGVQDNGIYIIFQHDGSENNTATFSYTVNDGSNDSNIALVTITITSTNDAPVITEGSSQNITMDEDASPIAFSLTLNATDAENDTLNWRISSQASNGLATATGSGSSKSINYVPNSNVMGSDSFVVEVSDGNLTDSITVNVTINPINDMPIITQIVTPSILEGDMVTLNAVVTDSDAGDSNDGSGSLTWSITSGNDGTMTISNTGTFVWIAPQTGNFNNSIGPIQLTVTDGLENGTNPATMSFYITVSPADDDGDGVANNLDFCPTIADSTNADNDNDGTAGTDIDATDTQGGDACDTDDDNDGMPDLFEDANHLNSKDASDANEDFDGDGISNIDEFNAGTNILLATLNIDATGYLTAYQLKEPDPKLFASNATLIFADNYGPYRPGINIVTWQLSNASEFNITTVQQILNIKPLVSLNANQQTAEGSMVNITASLNGDAVSYPVVISYIVSGTAGASDHNIQDGMFTITQGNAEATQTFNILQDSILEGTETAIITINNVTNAVKGLQDSHTTTIIEGNVQPSAKLTLRQNGNMISTAYIGDGAITISATINDSNISQSHTVNWNGSASSLSAPSNLITQTWTYMPTVSGRFIIELRVTDDGSPNLSTTLSTLLVVSQSTAPALLATNDSDGDGFDDVTEGYDDSDQDGVPDYLDPIMLGNLQVDQTVDKKSSIVLQTSSGLFLKVGKIARAAETSGAAITDVEIRNFASKEGGLVTNSIDSYEHIGGVYDFIIEGLIPGESAYFVAPLQIAIPKNAVYRKYTEANGWGNFTLDSENQVYSALGNDGACPEPRSNQYKIGLNYLDTCLQLKIKDGGNNDQDGVANGTVVDPGAISYKISEAESEEIVEEGGEIPYWLILILSALMLRRLVIKNKNY